MIKNPPTVEYPIDPLSIFYALPTGKLFWNGELNLGFIDNLYSDYSPSRLMSSIGLSWQSFDLFKSMIYNYFRNRSDENVTPHENTFQSWEESGLIDENVIEQQIKIKTAFGDVFIQPHEYTVIKDIAEYIEPVKTGEALIRFMSTEKQLSGKIADQVFYLRSRGIPYSDAVQMCIQNIKTQNLFYIEMHPELQRMFYRYFDGHWSRKLKYCLENQREDLLNYGPSWDYSNHGESTTEPERKKSSRASSKRVTRTTRTKRPNARKST